jgi:hypothetical protein
MRIVQSAREVSYEQRARVVESSKKLRPLPELVTWEPSELRWAYPKQSLYIPPRMPKLRFNGEKIRVCAEVVRERGDRGLDSAAGKSKIASNAKRGTDRGETNFTQCR